MDIAKKIAFMEEVLDVEAGTLKPEDKLADYVEWDSLSILTYVALMDSDFHKTVTGDVVKKFVTIQDAIDLME